MAWHALGEGYGSGWVSSGLFGFLCSEMCFHFSAFLIYVTMLSDIVCCPQTRRHLFLSLFLSLVGTVLLCQANQEGSSMYSGPSSLVYTSASKPTAVALSVLWYVYMSSLISLPCKSLPLHSSPSGCPLHRTEWSFIDMPVFSIALVPNTCFLPFTVSPHSWYVLPIIH